MKGHTLTAAMVGTWGQPVWAWRVGRGFSGVLPLRGLQRLCRERRESVRNLAGDDRSRRHHQGMKLFMMDMGREMFRPMPVTSYRMPPISAVMLRIEESIPRM